MRSYGISATEKPTRQGPRGKMKSGKNTALIVIFFTVFIDLVGFGIIIPLSPFLARQFNASPMEIGLLMSIYSIMQFLFSPVWGAWSDRWGRRPVILLSLFGGAIAYLVFAFANSLWLLFVARALAGVFGGNISAAHAYIADITDSHNRSKGMGMIGAAFGLGFIFGPLIGGVLGHLGQTLGSQPPFGLSFSALGAALICAANATLAFFVLRESLPQERRGEVRAKRRRFNEIWHQVQRPQVGSLVFVFFLSGLAMAQMESMLFPFVADRFGWDLKTASYGFAYVGVLMVITQGWLIRKWMPRFGEPFLLSLGLVLFAVSLFGVALSQSIFVLAVSMTILAVGNGLMRPPNLGMISILTPAHEQGMVMGVTNSLASLGRIIGPVLGGYFYDKWSQTSPFFIAGALVLVALMLIAKRYRHLPVSGRADTV